MVVYRDDRLTTIDVSPIIMATYHGYIDVIAAIYAHQDKTARILADRLHAMLDLPSYLPPKGLLAAVFVGSVNWVDRLRNFEFERDNVGLSDNKDWDEQLGDNLPLYATAI
jgi:hypothetical protein